MSSSDSLLRVLAAGACFGSCRRADLQALAAVGRDVHLPAGWPLIAQGTPADACYVLLAGRLRVVAGGQHVATLEPCAVVGEMGLLGRSLRTASVFTAEPVRALRVEYDDLARLLEEHPRLSAVIGQAYQRHLAAAGR